MSDSGEAIAWSLACLALVIVVITHIIGYFFTSSTNTPTLFATSDSTILKTNECTLEWQNLTYAVKQPFKKPKRLLRKISGSASPGEILAIMGASGSGKTTLLDVLSGNYGRAGRGIFVGRITFNGERVSSSLLLNKRCCYVFQRETLLSKFTVDEYLNFISEVMGVGFGQQQKLKHIRKLLRIDSIGDHLIGDDLFSEISGGQRRRVALAEGLLADSRLLFLDEPTTGLSASDAQELIDVLRDVADNGYTIVMTIHQPRQSIFNKIDNVLLLSSGGEQVYFGPTSQLESHFVSHSVSIPQDENIADAVIDAIEMQDNSAKLVSAWESEHPVRILDYSVRDVNERSVFFKLFMQILWNIPSILTLPREFWSLFKVHLRMAFRDWNIFVYPFLVDLFNGIMVGLIYLDVGTELEDFNDNISAIFSIIKKAPTFGIIGALYFLLKPNFELHLLVGRYRTFSFSIMWILRVTVHQLISSSVMAGLPAIILNYSAATVFNLWFLNFLLLMILSMLVSAYSVVTATFTTAVTMGLVSYLVCMTTNGFFIREDDVWVALRWLIPVTFVRQIVDAGAYVELGNDQFTCDDDLICPVEGDELLEERGLPGELLYDYPLIFIWVLGTMGLFSVLIYSQNLYQRWVIATRLRVQRGNSYLLDAERLDLENSDSADDDIEESDDYDTETSDLIFAWYNTTCTTIDGNLIVHGISGILRGGEVMAIMGPSGAGKSTLLTSISGQPTPYLLCSQTLIFNQTRVSPKRLRNYTSFMSQNDIIPPFITVEECLSFTADLRLYHLSYAARAKKIAEIVQFTRLKHLLKSKIALLSGGEKKRVSLAQTFLCTKPILILDEPTSGLSGADAKMIVEIIQTFAQSQKRIVILSIHQPRSSIFFMLDKLLLICRGYPFYFGPPANARNYFALHNMPLNPLVPNEADAILDLVLDVEKQGETMIETVYGLHVDTQKRAIDGSLEEYLERPIDGSRLPNPFPSPGKLLSEIVTLTELYLKIQLRSPHTGRGFTMQVIVLALAFSFLCLQMPRDAESLISILGSIYLVGIMGYAFVVLPQAYADLENLQFWLHDSRVGLYKLYTVVLVNFFVTHFRIAFNSIIFSTITYWMIGYEAIFRKYAIYVLGVHLLGLWGYLVASLFVLTTWSYDLCTVLSSNAAVVLTTISGYLLTIDTIPDFLRWMIWINPVYYMNEMIFVNELIENVYECDPGVLTVNSFVCPVRGEDVIDYYGYDHNPVLKDVLATLGLLACHLMLTLFGIMTREFWSTPAPVVRWIIRVKSIFRCPKFFRL